MTWTDLAPIVDDQFMKASFMNASLRNNINYTMPLRALRTSNKAITSNAVPADDGVLFFPMDTNELWAFRMMLRVTSAANGAGNLKVVLAKPAGGAVWAQAPGLDTAANSTLKHFSATVTTNSFYAQTTVHVYPVYGIIFTTTSPGTFALQWSQDSSSASSTTIAAGSCIFAARIGVNPYTVVV